MCGVTCPGMARRKLPRVAGTCSPRRPPRRARPCDAIAGRSAAILHGLPTLGCRTAGTARGRRRRCGPPPAYAPLYGPHRCRRDARPGTGRPVTTVARTLVELGRHDRCDAIMAADAALREELLTRADIDEALQHGSRLARRPAGREPCWRWPIRAPSRRSSRSPDCASTTRVFRRRCCSVWIGRDRVDFYWPECRLVLEADGRLKYTDEERWAEKKREQRDSSVRRPRPAHRAGDLVRRRSAAGPPPLASCVTPSPDDRFSTRCGYDFGVRNRPHGGEKAKGRG